MHNLDPRSLAERWTPALLTVALLSIHCSSDSTTPEPIPDAGPPDSGVTILPAYSHVEPTLSTVPAALTPQTWIDHLENDILPYWRQTEARGTPVGNFPTERTMIGTPTSSTDRRPRMLSRQTYAYAIGYLLTGDPELLRLAHAGAQWLLDHVPDDTAGGYHSLLDQNGQPTGNEAKSAQDTAYVMLGLAAYHFVTRSPAAEAELLKGYDLLFDPTTYFDADNQRIRDGMLADFSGEWDRFDDGGWELVSQLDPINAFMLLAQPVLSNPADRELFLSSLRTLSETMIRDFWQDGIFWGIHNRKGAYGTHHVDFGHTLKTHWMILQVDKRLDDHPFEAFLDDHAPAGVAAAFDADNGRWAKRPTSATAVEYGSDWWIYAEADQLAATLALQNGAPTYVDDTAANWLTDYVDTRPEGELIPGIRRDGNPVFNWPPWDTAKCNLWKNGYHSSEHALMMYLVSSYFSNQAATLYFAVPAADAQTFIARPYYLDGEETGREVLDPVDVDGTPLTRVRVVFERLY